MGEVAGWLNGLGPTAMTGGSSSFCSAICREVIGINKVSFCSQQNCSHFKNDSLVLAKLVRIRRDTDAITCVLLTYRDSWSIRAGASEARKPFVPVAVTSPFACIRKRSADIFIYVAY
jgi:hypothetical protein